MNETQGIPQLVDLTHMQDLLASGRYLLFAFVLALLLAAVYGVVLALLGRASSLPESAVGAWARDYARGLKLIQHGALVGMLLAASFAVGSTLSNRTHHWEQAQVRYEAATVEGERLEQQTPTVRWFSRETRRQQQYRDGKYVEVDAQVDIPHSLNLAASQVQVGIEQFRQGESERLGYKINFQGNYTVTNTLPDAQTFFFDAYLPSYYTLLEGFTVTRDGQALSGSQANERSFKFSLAPGESAKFAVHYQAQGAPRWVYTAQGSLLSNFSLRLQTLFPDAEFASGIPPTRTEAHPKGKTFVWDFKDNVSVLNPFGVFTTARRPMIHTGLMPRLQLLAPVLLLIWLLTLYLSLPLRARQVLATGGLFLAVLLAQTYLARLMPPLAAWLPLSAFVLTMVWLQYREQRSAALAATITALILPVLAFLTPFTGLLLALAALLAMLWLTLQQRREPVMALPKSE